jgi:hypothetical protein
MFGKLHDSTGLSLLKKYHVFTSFGLQYNLKCNARCECCYDLNEPTDNYLNEADAEKWIRECGEIGVTVFFCAGEPMLYWDWIKDFALPMCRKYGARHLISTNGYWGDDDAFIDDVIAHADNVTVSVDWWHQQWIPMTTINHLINRFRPLDVKTKLFISSVFNDEHPLTEVNLPYRLELMQIDFKYITSRLKNDGFTHDFDGNIVVKDQIVGKSIYDIDFSTSKQQRITDERFYNEYIKRQYEGKIVRNF